MARILTARASAYAAIQGALRRGELKRPARCQQCRRKRPTQAHHDDHSAPLKIRWLCSTCHGKGRRAVLMAYQVPAQVREKAKREGVSLRALILKLLKEWVEQ